MTRLSHQSSWCWCHDPTHTEYLHNPIENGHVLADVWEAGMDAVNEVLSQSPDDPDGRSQWVWVRLPNGDLILGVLPQGDTYFNVEHYVERDLHAAEKGEPPLLDIDRIVENLKRWVDG